jgi:hypothetical protein
LVSPLTTTGIVVIFVIFILLQRQDCHSACNIDPLSRGIGVQN